MQVDPIKPKLKAPRTNLLTLKCDELLSTFAFKSNLRRYSEVVQTFILADFCYYYMISWAEGGSVVRLPAGIV